MTDLLDNSDEPRFDVFLSHNSQDKKAVEALAARLKEEAGLLTFLDSHNLTPGQRWRPELERALQQSASLAFVVGASGPGPWQDEELDLALDRAVRAPDEFRVIPILLPEARLPDAQNFIRLRTWVDFREGLDDAAAFKRLVASIKGQAPEDNSQQLSDDLVPYRGLLPFDKDHARFFFGREPEIQTVLDKLKQHPFVGVVGASGVGKSSLVLGGVLPRLESPSEAPGPRLRIRTLTPGGQPLRALADQLATLVPPEARLATSEELTQRLASRPDALRTAVATLTADQPGTFLLVVDQLEELFTHAVQESSPQEVSAFLSNLKDAIEAGRGSIRIIATLRADFFDQCLGVPILRELLQDHQVLLGSMSPEALREAITRPAAAVGAFLEKGLVGTILRDVPAERGTLPLLEHALYELWRARRGVWLTLSAYEASGGVSGALQRRAQSCYERFKPEEQELVRKIFLRLTTLGEGTPDTRRRVARSELTFPGVSPAQVEHVLQELSGAEARLLVSDQGTVEVAHEVLIRQWSTLRRWLEEDRRKLRIHRRLTEATNAWTEHRRDVSYLYTGSRLLEAEENFASNIEPLNQWERDFLQASLKLRDDARQAEEAQRRKTLQRTRRAAYLLSGVALILLIAVLNTLNFWRQARQERDTARRERDTARSRELTTQAVVNLKKNPQQSLQFIQEAWRTAPTQEISDALAAWRLEPGVAVLRGHSGPVKAAAFSPDGSRLVTASEDRTVRIWEASSGKLLAVLPVHGASVETVAINYDGSRLITTDKNGVVRLWETISGKLLFAGVTWMAAFSSDGSRLITMGSKNVAHIWDASSGTPLSTFPCHPDPVMDALFSPDGSLIAMTSMDGTTRAWETSSGKLVATFPPHTDDQLIKLAFSPNRSRPEISFPISNL